MRIGSAGCQKIPDLFWQLPQVIIIPVQCGAMVSSSALGTTRLGSARCRQIWDLFWQLPQENCILVQCGAMVSSFALEETALGSARCQQIWDLSWQLPQEVGILVQCGAMVSSSALDTTDGFRQCDVPADLGPFDAVDAGNCHTCTVRGDCQLVCFEENTHG